MSKQVVLERIQSALKRHTISHQDMPYENMIIDTKDDLLEEYKHFQELNRAEVVDSSPENLLTEIENALAAFESQKLLYATDLPCDLEQLEGCVKIPYNKPVEEFREEIFHIDTAILKATCGVANLGMVGVVSSPASPRLTSLITLKCIILLEKSSIVRNLAQGLESLKRVGIPQDVKMRDEDCKRCLPTNMLFIGGPSRTADIELQTVFGVHGPMAVRVILY
ncbi:LutC/YkgG family protein [Helicobacter salomonis]|uniref:LutC/YkgG family protein n=1 Tax=Helicobacter salomonis TaxID=56878 RepID=UPI000CF10FB5|nr:lactate utilization protein C [Helicobacter salomonis]